MKGVSILAAFLLGVWGAQALEMSVGKVTTIEAVNGSSVRLPCFYYSCAGIENLVFYWIYNNTDYLMRGQIARDGADPHISTYITDWMRMEFVGITKNKDLSVMLYNLTWDDAGEYICSGTNGKEKDSRHTASLTLKVVDELTEVDNTPDLSVIIMSVVGAVIGLLVVIKAIKSLVTRFVLDENKEPLVSSTANDNSENGLNSSKADDEPKPTA